MMGKSSSDAESESGISFDARTASTSMTSKTSKEMGLAAPSLRKSASLEDGLFGVLYTLSKDRAAPSYRAAIFVIVSEAVQLLVFVLNARFPWGSAVTQFVNQVRNLQLQNPLIALGYNAYLGAFWSLSSIVLLCLIICVYVGYSFRENKFTLVWPILFVRRVVSVFITVLFTSSLNIFLTSFDCQFVGQEKPMLMPFGEVVGPDGESSFTIPCWEMPHGFTAIAGIVMSFFFTSLALVVSLVDFDVDMRLHNPLDSADPRAEALFFVAKTTLAVANVMLSDYPLVIAIIFAVVSTMMTLAVVWFLPYRIMWVNKLRTALFAMVMFSSYVVVAVAAYNNPENNTFIVIEVVGLVPAMALGWISVSWRERSIDGRRMLRNPATAAIIRSVGSGLNATSSMIMQSNQRSDRYAPHTLWRLVANGTWQLVNILLGRPDSDTPARVSPFSSPDQVERATRFVTEVDMACQLPDDIVNSIQQSVGINRVDNGDGDDDDFDDELWSLTNPTPLKQHRTFGQFVLWMGNACCRCRCSQSRRTATRRISDALSYQEALKHKLQSAIKQADIIFRHGLSVFPEVASLHLAYASFILAYAKRDSESLAKFHIDRARRLNTSFQDRFLIFLRDTERKHQAQGEMVGEASMDLVSYVEFQNNMEAAVNTHRATIKAVRRFWKLVAAAETSAQALVAFHSSASANSIHSNSHAFASHPGALHAAHIDALSHAFAKIDHLETKCNSIYSLLLEKYPRSVKLLRTYAQFATDILNDRKKAHRWYSEATRLEEVQRDALKFAKSRVDNNFGGQSIVDPGADGLIVITDKGVITSVNKNICKMFGYSEKELIGRNVSMLMGPPHSAQHTTYITNYLGTGVAHVLGSKRRVEARHKDGHVFAVELAVSQVENEKGVSFAGVMQKLQEDSLAARVTINKQGVIQSVNAPLLTMFGYNSPSELIHNNITLLMPQKYATKHPEYMKASSEGRGKGIAGIADRRLEGLHKNGMTFPITVMIEKSGEGEAEVFIGTIMELTNEYGVVSITEKGEILSVNTGTQVLFGYSNQNDLVGQNVSVLMPLPYAAFHNSYLLRYNTTGKGTIINKARHVMALHRDGTEFPVVIEVTELKDKDGAEGGGSTGILSTTKKLKDESPIATTDQNDTDYNLKGVPAALAAGLRVYIAKITLAPTNQLGSDGLSSDPLAGFISINKQGTIEAVNEKLCKIFGYPDSSSLIGSNVNVLMPEDVAADHDDHLKQYAIGRQPKVVGNAGRQLFGRRRDGSLLAIGLRVTERLFTADRKRTPVYFPKRTELPVEKPPPMSNTPGADRTPASFTTGSAIMQSTAFGGGGCPVMNSNSAARMAPSPLTSPGSFMGGCPVMSARPPPTLSRKPSGYAGMSPPGSMEYTKGCPVTAAVRTKSTDSYGVALPTAGHASSCHSSKIFSSPPECTAKLQDATGHTSAWQSRRNLFTDVSAPTSHAEGGGEDDDASVSPHALRDNIEPGQMFGDDWDGYDAYIYALEDLEASVTINQSGTIVACNASSANFFGYWREELIGHNVKLLMPKDVADVHDEYLANYRESKTKRMLGNRRVIEGKHRDGATLKLIVEVAERKVVKQGAAPGSEVVDVFFVARIVLATQSRTELEDQAKATVTRMLMERKKRKRAKDKGKQGGTGKEAQGRGTARSHTQSLIPTPQVPGEEAHRGTDVARAMGLLKAGSLKDAADAESSSKPRGVRFASGSDEVAPNDAQYGEESDAGSASQAPNAANTALSDEQNSRASDETDEVSSMNESEVQRLLEESTTGESEITSETDVTQDEKDDREQDVTKRASNEHSDKLRQQLQEANFALRHRERQLRQVSRHQRITTTATSLFTAGAWVTALIAFAIILPFAVMEYLVKEHHSKLEAVVDATSVAVDLGNLAVDSRRLYISQAQLFSQLNSSNLANAMWYDGSLSRSCCDIHRMSSEFTLLRDRLLTTASRCERTHRELYLQATANSLRKVYESPDFVAIKHVSSFQPYNVPVKTSLWDLGRSIVVAASSMALKGAGFQHQYPAIYHEVVHNEPARFVFRAADNGSIVVPKVMLEEMDTREQLFHVLSNSPGSATTALTQALEATAFIASDMQGTLTNVQIAIFVMQLLLPACLLLILIRPLLAKVSSERVAMYQVFVRIPHEALIKLSRQAIVVGEEGSEDDSTDDEEPAAREQQQQADKNEPEGNKEENPPEADATVGSAMTPAVRKKLSLDDAIMQSLLRKRSARITRVAQSPYTKLTTFFRQLCLCCCRDKAVMKAKPSLRGAVSSTILARRALGSFTQASPRQPVPQAGIEEGQTQRCNIQRCHVPPRIAVALAIVLLLVTALFISGFLLISSAGLIAADLRISGIRNALALRVKFFAQELVVAASAHEAGGSSDGSAFTVPASMSSSTFRSKVLDSQLMQEFALPISQRLMSEQSRTLDDYISYSRQGLLDAASQLEWYHGALLYGDASLGLPGQVHRSTEQQQLLFHEGCLRRSDPCLPKAHPYARITQSGLHKLLQYYIEQARQLANQTVAGIAGNPFLPQSSAQGLDAASYGSRITSGFANPRYEFLWTVAESDLMDGLQSAMDLYSGDANTYLQVYGIANGVIFALFMISLVTVYMLLFRPYITRISAESKRAAALLRSLPPELDLDTLIELPPATSSRVPTEAGRTVTK